MKKDTLNGIHLVVILFRAKHFIFYDAKNKISIFDIMINKSNISEEDRRNKRLEVIGSKILPSIGIFLKEENLL